MIKFPFKEKMALAFARPLLSSRLPIFNSNPNFRITNLSFSQLNVTRKVGSLSSWFARVGGVKIPNNKRIEYSLQYIHGIGRSNARQILNGLSFENKLIKDLSDKELAILREEVSKYMIEGNLRRFNFLAISRLKEIQCYRGIRHIAGLPCRGQKTKNNCRTLKKNRVGMAGKEIAIAWKKKK